MNCPKCGYADLPEITLFCPNCGNRVYMMAGIDYTEFISERTQDFTGREWVFQAINGWLAKDPEKRERIFLLTGEPGSGKSAVAARLVQMSLGEVSAEDYPHLTETNLVFFQFCQAFHEATLDPLRFVKQLSQALANRCEPFAEALLQIGSRETKIDVTQQVATAADGSQITGVFIESLHIDLSARVAFNWVVREPLVQLYKAGFDETIVILVDALDEALTYADDNIVTLLGQITDHPKDLPYQVCFILSSRPDPRVLHAICEPFLDLIVNAPDDVNDVQRYANYRLRGSADPKREDLATRIAKAGKGNFLYARYVIDGLPLDMDQVEDLNELPLPEDLNDIYRKFLERELARSEERWEERYRPLLGALAVAREPGLGNVVLSGASGLPVSAVDSALRTCAQYLTGHLPEGPLHIYHQSFREFLLDDPTYAVYPGEAHQALADFFTNEYTGAWHECGVEYPLRHTVTHLVQALQATVLRRERQRLTDDLAALLTDIDYLEARIGRGQVFDLIGDFTLALMCIPEDHLWQNVMARLGEILRADVGFIANHPEAFFQSCWNRGWWYDAQQAASYFEPPLGGWQAEQAPWDHPGEKLYTLLEKWRKQRKIAGRSSPWLRALRPLPDPLGSIQLAVFLGHGDESFKLDLSPDECRMVSAGGEDFGIVKLYDLVANGKELAFTTFGEGEFMQDVAYHPQGEFIAVALGDASVRLLHPERLNEIDRLCEGSSIVGSLVFSPDGRVLVTGDWNGELRVWDISSRQELAHVEAHRKVGAVAFAPDGSELASGGDAVFAENQMRRWRLDGGFQPVSAQQCRDSITGLAYSPDSELLACALYSEEIIVHDLTNQDVRTFHVGDGEHAECLAFTPDGKCLLAGAGDVFSAAYVYCWDLGSGQLKWKLPGHNFLVEDLIVFQGGRRLLTAGDNTIRLWDLERAAGGCILTGVEPDIDHARFSPDGTMIYTAGEKGETVWARRVEDGGLEHILEGHRGGVFCLEFSADGGRIACGCGTGMVKVWNTWSGEEWMTFSGHQETVISVAFSPNGKLLATGSKDGTARLVDLETRIETPQGKLHTGSWVTDLAFSPDGQLLLTGGYESMRIWDLTTCKEHSTYKGKTPIIHHSTCFTADSRYVVVEGVGEKLSAWEVKTGKPVPVEETHQQAYDRLKIKHVGTWAWQDRNDETVREAGAAQRPELILCHVGTGEPVAWLPIPYGGILHHPSGRIWGVRRGGHLYLFALEEA